MDLSTEQSFDPSSYGFRIAAGIKDSQIDPAFG